MSFRKIKWLVIAAPLLVVAVLEYSRWALAPLLASWSGRLMMDAVVLVGAVSFYAAVSTIISQLMKQLERQNRELQALQSASLDITADLSLDSVLEKIVDQARHLMECRYGALAVYDLDDKLETFVTSGIDAATRAQIGDPPAGKGLLRLPLSDGQHLRLQNLGDHPRSAGFPPNHPQMRSLLAVPVVCREPFRGNLYLSEKIDGTELTAEDEHILTGFSVQAAIAVDNAQLHAKAGSLAVMTERLRLAREMHDGQAQVLAYVNTKAQVVDHLMAAGDIEQARDHLEQMASAAREVYADVREGILGLRTAVDHDHNLAEVLRDYTARWQDQAAISLTVDIEGAARYSRDAELQILRIIQEALANVRKHSKAERAGLTVSMQNDRIVAEVEDDGVGFDPAAPTSGTLSQFGLTTMRERCDAIGATLDIRSQVGQGTLIRVEYNPSSSSGSNPRTLEIP